MLDFLPRTALLLLIIFVQGLKALPLVLVSQDLYPKNEHNMGKWANRQMKTGKWEYESRVVGKLINLFYDIIFLDILKVAILKVIY